MRYWIGVASKEHVARGIAGGFCQLCHGKAQQLKRMAQGDWIIYYSPKETYSPKAIADGGTCQQFTAIGRVVGDAVYQFEMAPGFIPFRRDIEFLPAQAADIRPLINQLNFIQNKSRWGYAFRFGHIEISQEDFELIAAKMLSEKQFSTRQLFNISPSQHSSLQPYCCSYHSYKEKFYVASKFSNNN